ncbi:hypothetical protein QQG55_40825 [Brugia pahangi]
MIQITTFIHFFALKISYLNKIMLRCLISKQSTFVKFFRTAKFRSSCWMAINEVRFEKRLSCAVSNVTRFKDTRSFANL